MKAAPKKSRENKTRQNENEMAAGNVRIELTGFERELLLKACTKYLYTIPAYIQSKQPEIEALNALIVKLA
jgi:hypothetical protein